MPTFVALDDSPNITLAILPSRHKFTREQVRKGVAAGVLPSRGWELLEGDIVDKMGKNFPHILVTQRVLLWLQGVFGAIHVVSQEPIVLSDNSEPEPDAAVLVRPLDSFQIQGFLPATSVCLVVEVSDTTLLHDQTVKARNYARAGITDYWIIDIPSRQILVHRQPTHNGYASVLAFAENETLAPLAAPQSTILAADLLPPVLP